MRTFAAPAALAALVVLAALAALAALALTPGGGGVGIASMVLRPHQLQTWVDHHTRMGVRKFYVFVDDPAELPSLQQTLRPHPAVRLLALTPEFKAAWGYAPQPGADDDTNFQRRQDVCVTAALEMARLDGLEFLVHIDSDELLHSAAGKSVGEVLGAYTGADAFKLSNIEMVPERGDYANCFAEGTKFRTDPRTFVSYVNGKGAGRVGRVKAWGPHAMKGLRDLPEVDVPEHDLRVLHYVSCNVQELRNKHRPRRTLDRSKFAWAKFFLEADDELRACATEEDCAASADRLFERRLLQEGEAGVVSIRGLG